MDARLRTCLLLVSLLPALGASARTKNFVVMAATPALAGEIAQAAEQMRRELAKEWLGRPLPDWEAPCPVVAHVSPSLGAGGRTSFMFRDGVPFGWEMEVQGSRERVLDSVLPHEVTHTIFATHFGCPLPRWADEGACTTVEHSSERRKQEEWLVDFLRSERGIPFNQMFAMKEYPGDILPLYSQGYSLARYLIAQGGKPKFVEFVGAGLQSGNWPAVVHRFYGYRSLGQLQLTWLEWVIAGSKDPASNPATADIQLASAATSPTSPAATAPVADVGRQGPRPLIDRQQRDDQLALVPPAPSPPGDAIDSTAAVSASGSWYARRQTESRLR